MFYGTVSRRPTLTPPGTAALAALPGLVSLWRSHFLAGVGPEDKPAVISWLQDHGLLSWGPVESKIVAKHEYTDETETVLYQSVRYEPKAFVDLMERMAGSGTLRE